MFLSYTKFSAKPNVWAWNPSSMGSWGRRTANVWPAWTSQWDPGSKQTVGKKKSASDWSSVEECLPRIQKTLASIPNAAKLVNKGICTNLRKGYSRIRMHCGDQLNNHTIKRVSMLYWLVFSVDLTQTRVIWEAGHSEWGIFLIRGWCRMPSLLGAVSSLDRWSWGV